MDFRHIDGILVRSGQSCYVGINKNRPFTRKRFTLAHELGHFLLHGGERFEDTGDRQSVVERQADAFAAELLMPSPMVKQTFEALTNILPKTDAIGELAWIYRVSREAMKNRLSELKIETENTSK